MFSYSNPVISGYNPDPSVCRVGDDFYLVTSTFEFFPGVPVYHSRNLTDWEMINHCLKNDKQLPLGDCKCSGGIFAPTIRYNKGRFYMVTTNVEMFGHEKEKGHGGNFYVYTDDIRGEWSDPIWLKQGGIDPSLLFDDDGKVYFTSTGFDSNGKQGIFACELNIETGEQVTESKLISYGSGARCVEGPHLYHIGNYYYLMTAEGGTEYGHMMTIRRSAYPFGPYEECPHNPILSHRDDSNNPIQATGHADICEDQHGNWWMVNLAIRKSSHAMLHNLGRETFLVPVVWDKAGWPVVGLSGREELKMEAPLPSAPTNSGYAFIDDFTGEAKPDWSFVRNPKPENYNITGGKLILNGSSESLSDYHPTFMGIRQKAFDTTAETEMSANVSEGGKAGISAFYNMDYHYDLCVENNEAEKRAAVYITVHGFTAKAAEKPVSGNSVKLIIKADSEYYHFLISENEKEAELFKASVAGLSTEGTMSMSFTGTFLGLFAENTDAGFDYFKAE